MPSESPSSIVVIGSEGRIGGLVADCAPPALELLRVGRASGHELLRRPPETSVPHLVLTRNEVLGPLLEELHPDRRPDLVFVQNGMLQPWLRERGLQGCTQGVLWVAVTHRGATPIPGGSSVFHGRWAPFVAKLLRDGGVDAEAVERAVLQREIAVKLAWICVFGPLGGATGLRVGVLAREQVPAIEAMVEELHPLLVAELALDLDAAALLRRLLDYSARIPDFPSAVKEWPWRNGWQLAAASALGLPQPATRRWLHRAGVDPVLLG